MWQLEPTDQFLKDQQWYEKKRPRELAAILTNLERYMKHLNGSPNSRSFHAGYLHNEAHGVVAVDQKGGGVGLQETRLYTYADDKNKVLYLITIGNKDQQSSDVEFSRIFADGIRKNET